MQVAAKPGLQERISAALVDASRRTGAGFDYLLKTAQRESNFNPSAKARTSSATGLFQFIDSTWLGVMQRNGERFGLGREAAAIETTGGGRYTVRDADMRAHIMALRKDPQVAALMAGAFTEDNASYLQRNIGRHPNDGELYIAHFLGAGGAAKMISLAESRPGERAADHFPAAARANKPIFYSGGKARTVAQVYANLIAKHDATTTPVAVAGQGGEGRQAFGPEDVVRGIPLVGEPAPGRGLFHALFRPAGQGGLGPAAREGLGTLSLFASPGPQTRADDVARVVDGVQAVPSVERAGSVSASWLTQRGAADAAAIDTRPVQHTPAAEPVPDAAAVERGEPARRGGNGFQRLLEGIASLLGLGRRG